MSGHELRGKSSEPVVDSSVQLRAMRDLSCSIFIPTGHTLWRAVMYPMAFVRGETRANLSQCVSILRDRGMSLTNELRDVPSP